MTHLTFEEQQALRRLLVTYNVLFDGALGAWHAKPVDVEPNPKVIPYHAKAYAIPEIHEKALKKKIACLVKLGILKKTRLGMGSSMFYNSKGKWNCKVFN